MIAETIRSRVVPEEEDVDFDAHKLDPLIMTNWTEMRVRAINHGLFDEKDSQDLLYQKLSTSLGNIQISEILANINSLFVKSNQKDAFSQEYVDSSEEGTARPSYYQPVNALEFWLIMYDYLKHHEKSDVDICKIFVLSVNESPSHGGYVSNLFYDVYKEIKTNNNVNAISVITPEDIQKNKSLEIVKGALSLAGIICGSLLLAGVITFPIASFALMLIGGCLISIGGLYSAYKLSETFAPQR
ncbi:MAG TPA: hypothetical protein DCZ80_02035 [Legionellales bacterium]|nr:hypothetical protein [Legionellales bacterium]